MDRELHRDTFAPLRAVARRLALDVLARVDGASGRQSEALARHRVHLVYMHALEAREEMPFRVLLSALSKKHRFISHSEAVVRVLSGSIDAPYVSFSFDDGLKSCLRAARILDEFSAPACFYVCPPMIGETDRGAIEKYCTRNLRIPPADFMNWNEICELLRRG
ncbi:MAG: hypothetical protein ABIZ80_22335, partial [Bryobacteraceae bacterium]